MAPSPQTPNAMSGLPYEHNMQASSNTDSPVMWITAAIVVGIVVIGGLIMFTILYLHKRRQFRKARQRDPYLSKGDFIKRRKMSAADVYEEDEQQRKAMIRKSLATRSMNSLESQFSRTSSRIETESFEMEEETANLRDDWKAWEARVQRERTLSGEQHPLAPELAPELAIPRPTRSRSPSRGPLLGQQAPSPPPRHPGRLST
ncbi:hypothetical protein V8F06_008273 [Rhypophila decipiens]